MEQPIRGSFDEGQYRSRSIHSDAARIDLDKKVKKVRGRGKTKNSWKQDSEKSFKEKRTIESLFEKDFGERLRNRIQIQTRFHFEDTEKYLPSDELGTIIRSDQGTNEP